MATDFSIALADVQNIKTVELTGLGVIKVKKLDSSAGFTIKDGEFRMMKLSVQMNQLGKSIQELSAEEQEAQADSLVKSMDKPLEEIKAIREYEKQAYDDAFSDDDGGKIVSKLTPDEKKAIYGKVFDES